MLNYFLLVDGGTSEQEVEPVLRQINPNFRLIIAKNGQDAARVFRLVQPPLVLINFRLSDMTGIQCIERLARINKKPVSHIYLYNDVVTSHLVSRAVDAGAKGCVDLQFQKFGTPLRTILDVYSEFRASIPGTAELN